MNLIEADKVAFSYGQERVLEDISFITSKGDFTGVLGPNGSGKTTLVKIILGLLENQKGRIKLFGQDIKHFDKWSEIGYLEQKINPPSLMPLTAFEVARLGLLSTKNYPRVFNKQDNQKTLAAMEKTGCDKFKNKLFWQLSGGQQQRVLLARTIINNPALLILDEPSTALDSSSRQSFFDLISSLNKTNGTTILLITHDIAEAGRYVNKFLILDKHIIFYGNKQDFCQSDRVTNYFGPYTQHLMDHLHTHDCCPFKEEK